MRSLMPINVPFLSEYPDFFAFAMVMLLVALLCVGVKESSILNNVFTVVNVTTIIIVVVAGSIKGKPVDSDKLRVFELFSAYNMCSSREKRNN